MKRNVLKNIFFSLVAVLSLGTAFFVAKVAVDKSHERVVETSAATYELPTSDGSLIIRLTNSSWTGAGSKTAVYFFTDASNGPSCWSNIIEASNKYQDNDYFVYPTVKTTRWTKIIVVRLNNSATTPSWDSKWNQTANITLSSSYNTYTPGNPSGDSTSCPGSKTTLGSLYNSGSACYVDLDTQASNVTQADAVLGIYFFGHNRGEAAKFETLSKVNGFHNADDSLNEKLYELVVPGSSGGYRWAVYERRNPAKTEIWDQSQDLNIGSKDVFKLNNWMYGTYDWTLGDGGRSNCYGRYFRDTITCSGSGSITSGSEEWGAVKTEYNKMAQSVKAILKNVSAAEVGSEAQIGMYKYDYIVFKKHYSGYDDFIKREGLSGTAFSNSPSPLQILASNSNNNNSALIIIVTISALSILGGYFFIRRKASK